MRTTAWTVKTKGGGRVSIVPRPRGGDWLAEEMKALRKHGIDLLISAQPPVESGAYGLSDEGPAASAAGMAFLNIPIVDMAVPPDREQFLAALSGPIARVREGGHVAVHCFASRGRSGVIAGLLLAAGGLEPEDGLERMSKARGYRVPETDEQRAWMLETAKLLAEAG
jgi:protein-tyrosine phosphatase